jgi:multidrug efflux pump subunit AcrA (membrane-fusion protein)
MTSRTGFVKTTLIVALLLCATVAVGSLLIKSSGNTPKAIGQNAITFEVFQGDFISSVNEVGDIESSSNVEIRCQVRSRGRTGVSILELVEEGTKVEEGDFLCQLDDSLLKEELTERKVRTAKDKALMIQSKSKLDAAQRKLREYEEGQYSQERDQLRAAISIAQESEKRGTETARHSATLNRKGYVTKTQLQADLFRAETAKEELRLAEEELRIYDKFTKPRIQSELTASIEQLEASLEADEYTLELSQQRELEIAKQVENCRLTAPMAGTVVYANETRGSTSIVIEEGASIRDGQTIFYLPDPTKMQVNAKVNDSKINKVEAGQLVDVRVDTAPETPIKGKVRRVSRFPLPRRYYQAPIEYEVFVDITEDSPLIRGGLRGKVEIFVEKLDNVIQCPVSSLVLRNDRHFVIVKNGPSIEARPVEIGSNNEKFVVVKNGLTPGDMVLVDGDNYRELVEFPDVNPAVESKKSATTSSMTSSRSNNS